MSRVFGVCRELEIMNMMCVTELTFRDDLKELFTIDENHIQ